MKAASHHLLFIVTKVFKCLLFSRNVEGGLREGHVTFTYVRARPPRIVLLVEDTNVMNVQVGGRAGVQGRGAGQGVRGGVCYGLTTSAVGSSPPY